MTRAAVALRHGVESVVATRGTIRTRILAFTVVGSLLALVLALGAYAFTLDRILYSTAMSTARTQASQVASSLVAPGANSATIIAQSPSQGAVLQLVTSSGQVVDASTTQTRSRALSALRPAAGQTLTEQVPQIAHDKHDPYAIAAVGLAHRVDGADIVLVAVPLQLETALVEGATIALAVLALILLALLIWFITRVINSSLRPVEQIRSSVASIRTSGSDARVPVPAGEDEISALARTMNDMLERLDRADAAQRRFVSNASHELRSPLTTLRAIAETSPEGLDADQNRVVLSEVVRMQHLVDDLLTLARADDHGLPLTRADVDVDDLLAAQVRRLRSATSLTVTSDVVPARVTGDELRLGQVLNNLTDNAARHARTAIRLGCRIEGGQVVVDVDNDGDPVPPADRELIFDRFVRLQPSRDRDSGGSGLGLAIARAVVAAHGGTVDAGETPDGWCRFTVRLPAQDLPTEDGPEDESETS